MNYLYYSHHHPRSIQYTRALMFPYIREWMNYRLIKGVYTAEGLSHNRCHAVTLIREAYSLGRIPVLKPPHLLPDHNFGYPVDGSWGNFYDLSQSYIFYKGKKHEKLHYVMASDFFKLPLRHNFSSLRVKDRDISPEENLRYRLIVREGHSLFLPIQKKELQDYQLLWCEQEHLRNIGDEIINRLNPFFVVQYRFPDTLARLRFFSETYRWELSVEFLANKLTRIFPSQNNLYVMANIWHRPDYFAALKKHYRVFRYHDFPQLRRFIESSKPNTFQLLVIEQYIFRKALKNYVVRWGHQNRSLDNQREFEYGRKDL